MASLKQLEMILKLRQDAEEKTSKMMQQALAKFTELEQQQKLLYQYKNDYLRKMTESGKTGLAASSYAQYHDLLTRLDQSIGRSQQQLAIAQRVVSQRQQAWQKSRADTKAIETLINKEQVALALKTLRAEQKQTDEFVNARAARNSTKR